MQTTGLITLNTNAPFKFVQSVFCLKPTLETINYFLLIIQPAFQYKNISLFTQKRKIKIRIE
jgi:hypothetical protein